jgi:predicted  nucleic acid-binding Zn-ribbon protein
MPKQFEQKQNAPTPEQKHEQKQNAPKHDSRQNITLHYSVASPKIEQTSASQKETFEPKIGQPEIKFGQKAISNPNATHISNPSVDAKTNSQFSDAPNGISNSKLQPNAISENFTASEQGKPQQNIYPPLSTKGGSEEKKPKPTVASSVVNEEEDDGPGHEYNEVWLSKGAQISTVGSKEGFEIENIRQVKRGIFEVDLLGIDEGPLVIKDEEGIYYVRLPFAQPELWDLEGSKKNKK